MLYLDIVYSGRGRKEALYNKTLTESKVSWWKKTLQKKIASYDKTIIKLLYTILLFYRIVWADKTLK